MTTLQNTSRARARRACAGAALLLCLAAGSTAQAGALYPFDPGFHGGSFIGESFGTATGWYQGRAIAPSWSPDGSRLAYATVDADGIIDQIFSIAPDGSGDTQLTTAGRNSNPAWR